MDALVFRCLVRLGSFPRLVYRPLHEHQEWHWRWHLARPLLLDTATTGGAWRSALVLLSPADTPL